MRLCSIVTITIAAVILAYLLSTSPACASSQVEFRGTVYQGTIPMPYAAVHIEYGNVTGLIPTDANGRYDRVYDYQASDAVLYAYTDNAVSSKFSTRPASGALVVVEHDFTMFTPTPIPPITFSGHVYDGGNPVDGAYVKVNYPAGSNNSLLYTTPYGTTDAGGYVISVPYAGDPSYDKDQADINVYNGNLVSQDWQPRPSPGNQLVHDFSLSSAPTPTIVATPEIIATSTPTPVPTATPEPTPAPWSLSLGNITLLNAAGDPATNLNSIIMASIVCVFIVLMLVLIISGILMTKK